VGAFTISLAVSVCGAIAVLLIPQGDDGVEASGFEGGPNAKEAPDNNGHDKAATDW
jgi:hypothetical protein